MASRESARRFHFLREIASGGFGSVFLAKVTHADGFSRLVAVKLLHRRWSENQEIAQRMRDEARLLGWLRHRNIVDVIDLTSIDGRAAVIMEYLEGVDLKAVVQSLAEKGERMPAYASLESVAFVASALDAAYNRPPYEGEKPLRVILRDIKPSNIMVDDAGTVKVLDFGVARGEFENRESHTSEMQFGSVEYMPPERLFFEPETDRADVYSLGATLFELLTGERLGKAKGRAEKHAAFLEDRLSFLSASCPLPNPQGGEVGSLVREMCAYNADHRPSSSQVVSRARLLARQMPGPALAEWAELVVRPLVAEARRAPREPNPLTETVLSEDSTIFGSTEAEAMLAALADSMPASATPAPASPSPEPVAEVPREDARWDSLRKAAMAEMQAVPEPASPAEDFGDEPTRVGVSLPAGLLEQAIEATAESARPAVALPLVPGISSESSAPLPRAKKKSGAAAPELPTGVKQEPLQPVSVPEAVVGVEGSGPTLDPEDPGPALQAEDSGAPAAHPFSMLPEIRPDLLDPPSAEELKPKGIPARSDAELNAGLARLRANVTMVPEVDDADEPPTTMGKAVSPTSGATLAPEPAAPRAATAVRPPLLIPAPPASPPRPPARPPKPPAPAAARASAPVRAAARPAFEPEEEPEPAAASRSGVFVIVGVIALCGLLGLGLGGSYVGYLYWSSHQAVSDQPAGPVPATTTPPEPTATPAAAAPEATVPAAAAATLASPTLGPADLLFAGPADARSMSVDCGGVEQTGVTEVFVAGPVTSNCLVTLVKKDRSRLRADVESPAAGRWTCFAGDAKACTK